MSISAMALLARAMDARLVARSPSNSRCCRLSNRFRSRVVSPFLSSASRSLVSPSIAAICLSSVAISFSSPVISSSVW